MDRDVTPRERLQQPTFGPLAGQTDAADCDHCDRWRHPHPVHMSSTARVRPHPPLWEAICPQPCGYVDNLLIYVHLRRSRGNGYTSVILRARAAWSEPSIPDDLRVYSE